MFQAWRLADIEYPEDKYRNFESSLFGGRVDMSWRETCFCWCFWSLAIPISDLENSDAILVRAMDEALNIQPRDMYWSVLGMMNNPWFRVAITKEDGILRFEHPTLPVGPGGWMERVKKAGGDLTNGYWGDKVDGEETVEPQPVEEINMKKKGLNRVINIEELRKHNTTEEPWFVVNGEVYDGTKFLEGHPGGAQSIISVAGMDASEEFLAIRKLLAWAMRCEACDSDIFNTDSETAKALMVDYHIGTLDKASLEILKNGTQEKEKSTEPRAVFLQPRSWTKAPLCEKKSVSWDTRIFTFELEHEKQTLGLPVGQHLMLRVKDPSSANDFIIRSYTPTSETNREGTMELLVKIYFETPTSPGGKMTTALDKLPLGSVVEFKGPIGKFEYLGRGKAIFSGKERQVRSFRMICGGSGITPIFQVLRAVMQDPQDQTSCVVLDGNKTEEDILCKEDLDAFAAANGHKCTIVHTLSRASNSWTGRRGRISEELLREYASPCEGGMVLVCGPEAMEKSVRRILLAQGWKESDLVFF